MPTPPNNTPFYVVDFDRTLADSDKLLGVFIEIVNQYIDLPMEQVQKIDADIKAKGDSFDTATYVRDQLASADRLHEWQKLEQQFIRESRSLNMLLPGAAELLALFDARGDRYGILTYGNPFWQHLKLSASGFNRVKRIVTTDKYKGALISSWLRPETGEFMLPAEFGGGVASEIVLIDDKAASFRDYPDVPSRGYHVLEYAHALPAQLGAIPRNVQHVATLGELKELL